MIKPARQFSFSLIDQGTVSAGNFLTIALGANFLPIPDQGKLIYIYTLYIAIVLFNIAAFFSSANVVRNESGAGHAYKSILTKYQMISACLISLAIFLAFFSFQHAFGLRFTWLELTFLALFILLQQLADFYRRAGYVFGHIRASTVSSIWLYGIRIAGILYFQPDTLTEFLVIIIAPLLPIAIIAILEFAANRHNDPQPIANKSLLHLHLSLSKWGICTAPLKWAGLHLPVILAGVFHSVEAAAILGSIRALTTFANVFLELLETFIPAWLASSIAHGQHVLKKRSTYLLCVGAAIWLAGLLLIGMAGEAIVQFLLGQVYSSYSNLLYIIWVANGLYFIGRIIGVHYRTLKNAKLEFIGSLAGAVALLFALPLIYSLGAWGAAWCLAIAQTANLAAILAYRTTLMRKQVIHAN